MGPFRFRLAKVMDWYKKQSHLEAERLRMAAEQVIRTKAEIVKHQNDVLAHQMEVLASPNPDAHELASLGPFQRRAKRQENWLQHKLRQNEEETERQRTVTQAAQRRLRLIEKLRERRLAEYQYEFSREIEEVASEAYLARFARALHESPSA
jgi:flagellar export protein FliJ